MSEARSQPRKWQRMSYARVADGQVYQEYYVTVVDFNRDWSASRSNPGQDRVANARTIRDRHWWLKWHRA